MLKELELTKNVKKCSRKNFISCSEIILEISKNFQDKVPKKIFKDFQSY